MSLTGTEWQDLAVFERSAQILNMKKSLTDEEEYVILWLNKKVKVLSEKKIKK